MFKPVRSEPLHDENQRVIHIPFSNKGIDAINFNHIPHRKEVVSEIPPYFKISLFLLSLTTTLRQ